MSLKAKLQDLIYQDSAVEMADEAMHFRLTATEAAMLAMMAQAYKLKKGQVLRRLIRQAAIDYSQDGESIGLLHHNNSEVE